MFRLRPRNTGSQVIQDLKAVSTMELERRKSGQCSRILQGKEVGHWHSSRNQEICGLTRFLYSFGDTCQMSSRIFWRADNISKVSTVLADRLSIALGTVSESLDIQ